MIYFRKLLIGAIDYNGCVDVIGTGGMMFGKWRSFLTAGTSVALVALTLGAFSSNWAAASTSKSKSHVQISVGAQLPLTGTLATYGAGVLTGIKTGVTEVNNAGGVLGSKLNLHVQDDGGDAVDALPAFRTLLLSHPVAVFGMISNTFPTVAKLFDLDHIVDFGLLGGTPFYKLPADERQYVYHAVVADPTIAAAMADMAISKGYKSCAGIFGADESSQTLASQVYAFYKAHGGTITAQVSVQPAQSSYRSELALAFANSPKCVFIQTDPITSQTLFSDATSLSLVNVPFIGSDEFVGVDEAKAMGCPAASQYLTGTSETAPNSPAYAYMNGLYHKLYHTAPTAQVTGEYDAVIIAALAMTAAHSSNPTKWNPYVRKVTSPGGLTVYNYAQGVKALKAGLKISYSGAYTSSWNFNKFGDIFTSISMVQYNSTCTATSSAFDISAAAVNKFSNG